MQKKAEEKQNESMGLHKFVPHTITVSLSSPLFHLYIRMICELDQIPDELAQEQELCICHGPFAAYQSQYKRQQMMQHHYSLGCLNCPLAGFVLPELVVGRIDKSFERIVKAKENLLFLGLHLEWGAVRGSSTYY